VEPALICWGMLDFYPVELRARVVAAYEAGRGTYPEIGALFGVGEASVRRWVKLHRDRGDLEPLPKGGGVRSIMTASDLEAALRKLGDANAGELTAEVNRDRNRPTKADHDLS